MDASLRKRQKVASACERCRKRKLGCDAQRPCLLCVRAGAECIPRDRAYSDITASTSDRTTPSHPAQHEDAQSSTPIMPESNIVDLSTLIIQAQGSNASIPQDTSSLPGGQKHFDPTTNLAGPRQWPNITGVHLPADHVLDDLLHSFFSSVNWFMMVFHEEHFRQRYAAISKQEHIKYQDTTFYWTCLLVIALGAHYAVLKDPGGERSAEYRTLSKDLISVIESRFLQIAGCPTVESVQICVLLGSFIFYTRPTTGLGICGMGVKIAQVISLHREGFWKETSLLVREEKRRTWWALEVFDKYAAVAFGRPCIIDDSDCAVSMITDIDLQSAIHVPTTPLILYQQHKFRLYRIMGAFLGRKRRPDAFESIDSIHQKMLDWRRDLPAILTLEGQVGPEDGGEGEVTSTQIQALSLQLTYDNLQIILHRTAVFTALDDRSLPSLTESSTSMQQLLASAMATSNLHRHPRILDACQRTHADVHIGITMFTAGVVLCAICLSQPLTEMGSTAKTGVMHIMRICRETTSGVYGEQILSKQSLGIIESLVGFMLQKETDLITGRVSRPTQVSHVRGRTTSPHDPALDGRATSSASNLNPGPGTQRPGRVLEPIQEGKYSPGSFRSSKRLTQRTVFGQHIPQFLSASSVSGETSSNAASSTNFPINRTMSNNAPAGSFDWHGDASVLVDSGLVDASQLWLWADNLGYESFNNQNEDPRS